ncbi:MOSC domain-containing protein [Pararhodobacter sp.]|uniref:MOSC domain-containing protein n=1 Tax=Pararhodobacter sp. TaxID=2127056 RepID=UPI002FDEA7E6
MSGLRLAYICRHPVKSVGYEEIERVALTAGHPLPFDRNWAVSHEAAGFDQPDGWQPKLKFVRGWAEGSLQAIRAEFDDATRRITLSHPARPDLTALLPEDGPALVDWLRPLWPERRPAPAALVARRDGGALTDVPEPYLSILSLSSNRALGQRLGQDLSIHRWRGNLWLDGLAPWEEFDLIGRTLAIGTARLTIEQRITRCRATCANPETGRTDADTLGALEEGYGHIDFGVYARVIQAGDITRGDPVEIVT